MVFREQAVADPAAGGGGGGFREGLHCNMQEGDIAVTVYVLVLAIACQLQTDGPNMVIEVLNFKDYEPTHSYLGA